MVALAVHHPCRTSGAAPFPCISTPRRPWPQLRTIIDLRNDDELRGDVAPRRASIAWSHLPLDGCDDREFWNVWASGPQFGTPLYYRPHLERMPQRSVAVLVAITAAAPGVVAFHCGAGRDRAGQIATLLLALVGVAPRRSPRTTR